MAKHRKTAMSMLLGATALSSSAFAQEERRFDVGLQARAEYNSNVAKANDEQAALRGLEPEDVIFTPAVTVNAYVPFGRQSVFLLGSAGYSFYDRNEILDRERFDVSSGVNLAAGPCSATVSGGYLRGVNQIEDPTLVEDARNIQETRRVAVNGICVTRTGWGVVAAASQEWVENDQPFQKLSDSRRKSARVGASYSRPQLGTLTVFAEHQETEYPNRLIDDGFDLDAFGVQFERQLGARIQGSVTAAFSKVDPHFQLQDEAETTTYNASLSYRVNSRLRLEGEFDRSVTPASGLGRTYDLTQSYGLFGYYDIGSRINVSLGFSVTDRDSKGGLPTITELTDSETTAYLASIRYRQSKRLSFLLSGGREERTTNAPQFDYTNDRIGLTAEVAF